MNNHMPAPVEGSFSKEAVTFLDSLDPNEVYRLDISYEGGREPIFLSGAPLGIRRALEHKVKDMKLKITKIEMSSK